MLNDYYSLGVIVLELINLPNKIFDLDIKEFYNSIDKPKEDENSFKLSKFLQNFGLKKDWEV